MDQSFRSINQSCLNNSSSKQLYSFSRSQRFRNKTQTSRQQLIQMPSIFDINKSKGPSFTKVIKKLVFQNEIEKSLIPPPTHYSPVDPVITCQSRVSHSIGSKLNTIKIKITPGPQYNYKSLPQHSRNWSFSKQTKQLRYPVQMLKGNNSPGPKYLNELSSISKVYSKFKSAKAFKIIKAKNLFTKHNNLTEPIHIQKQTPQNPEIAYIKSRLKKQYTPYMPKSQRPQLFILNNNPGPGNYNRFTQFAKIDKLKEDHNKSPIKNKTSFIKAMQKYANKNNM